YKIYWATSSGVTTGSSVISSGASTSYTHSSLANGTTYYYRVAAVNSSGESSPSSEFSAAPTAVPSNLNAVVSSTQVVLSWTAATGATAYKIYWATSSGVTTGSSVISGIGTNSYTHTGLTNLTTYYYRVAAVFGSGAQSALTSEVNALPGADYIDFCRTYETSITASAASASAPTLKMEVYENPTTVGNGGSNSAQIVVQAGYGTGADHTAFSYRDIAYLSVRPDNTNNYWYQGAVYDTLPAIGNYKAITRVRRADNPTSTWVYCDTDDSTMTHNTAKLTDFSVTNPPAPTSFTATGGNGQVSLSWDAVPNATSYTVAWATVPIATTIAATIEGIGTNSYTHTGLTNGTTYYYQVYANFSGSVTSDTSAEKNATPVAGPILLFSEYVEGSSNNKALEIFNAGSATVDLSNCIVRAYLNDSTTPSQTVTLSSFSLGVGSTFVICNSSIDAFWTSSCQQYSAAAMGFNGDDRLDLICSGQVQDVIGQTNLRSTFASNLTLRRKCSVTTGDKVGTDAFDHTIEWDSFAQDTFSGMGAHSCP
ncbi:MAG: fibronectin type III domain-containing protein, partial [Leptospiraceae bacterium]|nr:fibronectin type III domain-containing protein [Leptospiraceae bacterium]